MLKMDADVCQQGFVLRGSSADADGHYCPLHSALVPAVSNLLKAELSSLLVKNKSINKSNCCHNWPCLKPDPNTSPVCSFMKQCLPSSTPHGCEYALRVAVTGGKEASSLWLAARVLEWMRRSRKHPPKLPFFNSCSQWFELDQMSTHVLIQSSWNCEKSLGCVWKVPGQSLTLSSNNILVNWLAWNFNRIKIIFFKGVKLHHNCWLGSWNGFAGWWWHFINTNPCTVCCIALHHKLYLTGEACRSGGE